MRMHIERFNNFACVPSTFVYFRHVKHDERKNLFKSNNKNCKLKIRKTNMQKMHKGPCTYQIELKSVQILLFLLEFTDALINFIIWTPSSILGKTLNKSSLLSKITSAASEYI